MLQIFNHKYFCKKYFSFLYLQSKITRLRNIVRAEIQKVNAQIFQNHSKKDSSWNKTSTALRITMVYVIMFYAITFQDLTHNNKLLALTTYYIFLFCNKTAKIQVSSVFIGREVKTYTVFIFWLWWQA